MLVDPTAIPSLIDRCIKIYKYLQDMKESSEERRRLMRGVMAFRDVIRNLQEQLSDPALAQNPSLMTHLAQLFDVSGHFVPLMTNTVRKLEEKLIRGVDEHKTGWRATATKVKAVVLWPMDKDEVKTLLAELERYKTLVLLAMEQDSSSLELEIYNMTSDMAGTLSNIATTTASIKETIDAIGVAISADDRRKVAEWISKIDFSAYHAENSRKWLPGTGNWVLKSPEFRKWESRKASSPTLWCYGDAGAGKSVIAAMIVEHLRSISGNIVLVIVCRYNQAREYFRETYTFLCCLLRQLLQLERASNVPSTLLESYQNGICPSNDILGTLLIDAARLIKRPIFIVLDALDECPLGFDLVAAIQRLGNDFNLLITSRNVFSQRKEYPSLHIRAADRDILALVNSKIPKLRWVREDKDLQSAVRSEVVSKAAGMFLLASLTLWELEHDIVSKIDVHRVLNSIPVSLHDAYHQIFKRIGDQGYWRKRLALNTIMWIYMMTIHKNDLFEQHHMNYATLSSLLVCEDSMSSWDPAFWLDNTPSMEDIVDSCCGLVINSGTWSVPAFIHYSVQEYISRSEPSIILSSKDPYDLLSSKDPYDLMFKACTNSLYQDICYKVYLEECYNRSELPLYMPLDYIYTASGHLHKLWVRLARFLDSYQPSGPATVQYALADKKFTKTAVQFCKKDKNGKASTNSTIYTPWIIDLFLDGNSSLTALDYAAAFGLPNTFRLAQEAQDSDKHELQQTMAIAVGEGHWDFVKEVWAHGDYDINLFCNRLGSTAVCELVSSADIKTSEELRRSFLLHSSTSLWCPRHESLLGCALRCWRTKWIYPANIVLENITIILERLSRDVATSRSCQPARFFQTYPSPSSPRSHPPQILDVIVVLMQTADINLDAQITQMVPPEILLALLMLPWHFVGADDSWFETIKESAEVLRPYARRPVSNVSISDPLPNTDVLANDIVPVAATSSPTLGVHVIPNQLLSNASQALYPHIQSDSNALRAYEEIGRHLTSKEDLGRKRQEGDEQVDTSSAEEVLAERAPKRQRTTADAV